MPQPTIYPYQVRSAQDLPGEEWLPITGLEGLYEISNMGRVKSLHRSLPDRNGRLVQYRGVMRRQSLDGSPGGGYPVVSLMRLPGNRSQNGRAVIRTHLLVAEAFLGSKPDGMVVRHLNGDPRDARLVNLRYGTEAENQMDRNRHGTHNRGERHPNAKLTDEQIDAVRELMQNGVSPSKVAEHFGIHPSYVRALARGEWRSPTRVPWDIPEVPPLPDLTGFLDEHLPSRSGEEWRDVPGWESRYQVSNHGRVRSLLRGGMVLRPAKGKYGHRRVTFTRNGRSEAALVHRLVAEAFIGPAPFYSALVLHIDGDPSNNHTGNLKWGSYSENAADAKRHGTQGPGELSSYHKLTEAMVRQIRRLAAQGLTYSVIGEHFGITGTQASAVARGKAWGHVDMPTVDDRIEHVAPISESRRDQILKLRGKGLSVTKIAGLVGVNPSTVSRLTTDGKLTAQRESSRAVADQVRTLVDQGMTQKEVAAKFGISRASVSRIVNGKVWVTEE